jgi:type I restriction enzyme M protein
MPRSSLDYANFIWSIADLLRGDYKAHEYGQVILPLTVLRRLDCVLAPTKAAVLKRAAGLKARGIKNPELALNRVAGQRFHNTSKYDFPKLLAEPDHLAPNLSNYIRRFSVKAKDLLDHFRFEEQVERLQRGNILYQVVERFARVDLHPDHVSNVEMGHVFEELIRRFAEASNETAGEHFTPRDVIRLMVSLLFVEDSEVLRTPGVIRTLYDPTAGTGGMLSVAEENLRELNPDARLEVFGQELNPESYAICVADLMMKGQDPDHIKFGNSFTQDGFVGERFDYMLSNPPFGVEWKKVERQVRDEKAKLGFAGRFGAGLPRINDGSLLFLQHMIAKLKPAQGNEPGGRLAIVLNGSPLFTGGAGSGESEIRKWILENDWLEAIVALPDQLFYNTGINTYVWIVTNRKRPERRGKVQLIDATALWRKMPKSLGNKRKYVPEEAIGEITRILGELRESEVSKVFPVEAFGYQQITVERPLREAYEVTPEAVAVMRGHKAVTKLATKKGAGATGRARRDGLLSVLDQLQGRRFTSRPAFETALADGLTANGIAVPAPVLRAVRGAMAVRDPAADVVLEDGEPVADPELRDTENVPLGESINDYMAREVQPHYPDAWVDEEKTVVGYEIPFTRHFYRLTPPRPLAEIEADLREASQRLVAMLQELHA